MPELDNDDDNEDENDDDNDDNEDETDDDDDNDDDNERRRRDYLWHNIPEHDGLCAFSGAPVETEEK